MQGMMDCVVFTEVGKYEITQKPIPQLKRPNDVLVKVLACSICGTDVHILATPPQYPAIPGTIIGHEIVGEVVECGESVTGFKPGDRLIMDNNIACGTCEICKKGDYNVCPNMKSIGMEYDGAFAQYLVCPDTNLAKINKDVPIDSAIFAEPLNVAMATAMAASMLAACGGSSDSASSAAASAASSAAEAVSEAASSAASEAEEAVSEAAEAASSAASSAAEEGSATADAAAEGWVLNMDDMLSGSPFEGLTPAGDYKYQLIVKSYSASFFQAVQEGAEAAANELGVQLDCNGPNTESDIADQVNMFNAAILNGMDGVAIAPSDAKSIQDNLLTAMDKNVPIVAFDSAIDNAPEGSVLATVATDSPAAGKIGAENVYNAVSYKVENADAPIRIGMIAQDNTSRSNSERGMGFVDGIIELGKADGYKVAVTGTDFFVNGCTDKGDENDCDIIVECRVPSVTTVDQCANEVSAVLNKEDTVAVFGTNQTVTEGIIQANNNLNKLTNDPETGILGTGFDAGAVIKDAVASGTLYGCVTQMPYAMGYYTIATMVANNNGDEVGDLPIPAYWYNADNMDDPLIAPNLYD